MKYIPGKFYKKKIFLSGNPNDGSFAKQLEGQKLKFIPFVIKKYEYQWELVLKMSRHEIITEYEMKLFFKRIFKKVKNHLIEFHKHSPYKR